MSRLWIAILLLVVALTGTGSYIWRNADRKDSGETTRIVHPEARTVSSTVNATGTVRLRVGSEVRVGAQISGIVKKLNVTVGSHVRAGDLIAQIDDALIQARLAQAEAQAELDRATLERARVNADRARTLSSEGLIPSQQEEDLQLALRETKAKYEKALRDRDLVKVDRSYVTIRAPISGTIASVSTQEGETVAASFAAPTFVTIIADEALQLVAMVDETDIANVRKHDPVTFLVDSYPSREFAGVVESIAPKASIVSGVVNYEVTITIGKDMALLKPDMTANGSVQTAQHDALLLPTAAIQRDGEQSYVYIPGKDGPSRRPVVVGAKQAGMTEIKRGLSAGDEILVIAKTSPAANQTP